MGLNLNEKLKRLDAISSAYNDKSKKVVAGRITNNDMKDILKIDFIEFPSLKLTAATGGGIPKGKFTIVTGAEDSGKTAGLLEVIGNEQKKDPSFVAGWLESENSLTEEMLNTFGIDKSRFFFQSLDSTKGAEEALDITIGVMASGAVDMFVINSLKCLTPQEELIKDMGSAQVGLQARMNSKLMRKAMGIISDNNVAFVAVQHLTTEIGKMFGDPLTMGGGRAIKYAAHLILDYRKLSIQEQSDPIKKDEGLKIGVTVKKNHIVTDRFPYVKTEYYAIYKQGTETRLEVLEEAIEKGLMGKAGAYIRLLDENGEIKLDENGKKIQWCGVKAFRQYCIENPIFFEKIRSKCSGTYENLDEEEIKKLEEEEKQDEKFVKENDLDIIKESKK